MAVCLSLSWVLVGLAACVCISDFPCVFVSACISGWVGVQWSSRRTFGSRSPPPTSNCPWCPAELPNDFTYLPYLSGPCGRNRLTLQPLHAICCLIFCEIQLHSSNCSQSRGISLSDFLSPRLSSSVIAHSVSPSVKHLAYMRKYKHKHLHHSTFSHIISEQACILVFERSEVRIITSQCVGDRLWMSGRSFKQESLDVCGHPQVFSR